MTPLAMYFTWQLRATISTPSMPDNGQLIRHRMLDGRPYRLADAEDPRNYDPVTRRGPGEAGNLATPFFGITSTPAIDPESKTLFVVSKTDEQPSSAPRPHEALFHLHALDLGTLEDKPHSPLHIGAENGELDPENETIG
jgi:hypothetical protein